MKRTILALLSVAVLATSAFGQTTRRQNLNKKINTVYTEDATSVLIVHDTADYVLITDHTLDGNPFAIMTVRGSRIAFSSEAMDYTIELHLSAQDLRLHAEDESSITLRATADTLRLNSLYVHAEDEAAVAIEPHIVANRVDFYTEDASTLNHNGFCANSGTEYFTGAIGNSLVDTRAGRATAVSSGRQARRTHYGFGDRFGLQFLWGWNNWGTSIGSGLMGTDGDYELRTTFSSYQLAALYDVVKTPVFAAVVGIGYESDIYKFSKRLVAVTGSSPATIAEYSPDGTTDYDGRSRLVTRYVTLPIGVVFNIDDFNIALTAVPGLGYTNSHTGLKTKTTIGKSSSKETNHTVDAYLNPYKLDLRLSIGWHKFGLYVQPSLLPVMVADAGEVNHIDRTLYPVKFGFQLGF